MPSRRTFLKSTAAITLAASLPHGRAAAADSATAETPWCHRTLRWGQTNLTEIDPVRIDIDWWRAHWKRTRVQGVVVKAGGIVAFYPTEVPFHRRAKELGSRDLFGELCRAAHEDGLAVFARMDSSRADEAFYRAYRDWFAHDADGKPYTWNGLYIACVNSPYYHEYIPAILREIAVRYRPEGFTDNNWNGPMRHQPCFCTSAVPSVPVYGYSETWCSRSFTRAGASSHWLGCECCSYSRGTDAATPTITRSRWLLSRHLARQSPRAAVRQSG